MKDGKKSTITRRQSIGLIAGGAGFLATQPILTLPAQEADRQLIEIDPASLSIHTDFEGGALGKIVQVAGTHFRCGVKGESDQDGRNRQANWYYFRVDGAKDQALTLDLVDLPGEYNYRPNRGAVTGETLPWYSEDNRHWRPVETVEYQPDTPLLRLRLRSRANKIWIAHVPPYTNQQLQRLLDEFKRRSDLRQQTVGRTAQGRAMLLLTVTDESEPAKQKKVIWLMFRQHSWEAGSSWAGGSLEPI